MNDGEWRVLKHKSISKLQIPLLEAAGLKESYDEIIDVLKKNPFSPVHGFEKMRPRNKNIYSMRINNQHRVVYTVDKKNKIVKIWAAWSHYEKNIPK